MWLCDELKLEFQKDDMRILFYVEATLPLRPAADVGGSVSHYLEHHQHQNENVGDHFEQSKYLMQIKHANNVMMSIPYRTVVHCETPTKVWLRALGATPVTGQREMVYELHTDDARIREPEEVVSFLQESLPPFLEAHLRSPRMKVLCMPDGIRVRFIDALSEEEWCERGGMLVRFSVWALVAPGAVTPAAGAIMHQQPGYAIHAQAPIREWLTHTLGGLQVDETAFVYEVYIPMEELDAGGGAMTREQRVKEVLCRTIPPALAAHLITDAMRVFFNYPCNFFAHFTHAAPDQDLRVG